MATLADRLHALDIDPMAKAAALRKLIAAHRERLASTPPAPLRRPNPTLADRLRAFIPLLEAVATKSPQDAKLAARLDRFRRLLLAEEQKTFPTTP